MTLIGEVMAAIKRKIINSLIAAIVVIMAYFIDWSITLMDWLASHYVWVDHLTTESQLNSMEKMWLNRQCLTTKSTRKE